MPNETTNQKMHELYLKRRSQRIVALKNVVKQWRRLEEAETFFDSIEEAQTSMLEGDLPDLSILSDVATWKIGEKEGRLDVAIDRLVTANQRVHDAYDAMDGRFDADQPGAPYGNLGDCFATKKTRWPLVFYNPLPAGVKNLVELRKWRAKRGKPNNRNSR
jgi:hypothetical protein